MAVSQLEEKILGRLARQTAPSSPLLSASLYQVLGLSILLSRRLYRARKLRKLDTTRETKSLQLYHHIVWLAREGLAITEAYILPHCQDGEEGPECRVMAAKLRASFYHVFCLYHNHPPISQLSARSVGSESTPSGILSPRAASQHSRQSPRKTPPKITVASPDAPRRPGNAALRDAIPSITSETSYVTNPFDFGPSQTPPPPGPPPPIPTDARRTPTRPPGLAPINISATQAAASFLLPPLNFVPMAREHFETAQQLANSLLSAANALRLSVSLEHAAFLWDCDKSHDRARRLARKTIKEVYKSPEGLDDDEFADASALVQNLGGIVRRGTQDPTPQPSDAQLSSGGGAPMQRPQRTP
ncbi:14-3-3 protein, partial [Polychaeton citri CBS 116435]